MILQLGKSWLGSEVDTCSSSHLTAAPAVVFNDGTKGSESENSVHELLAEIKSLRKQLNDISHEVSIQRETQKRSSHPQHNRE